MTDPRLKLTPGEYTIHPDGRAWKVMGPETEGKDQPQHRADSLPDR